MSELGVGVGQCAQYYDGMRSDQQQLFHALLKGGGGREHRTTQGYFERHVLINCLDIKSAEEVSNREIPARFQEQATRVSGWEAGPYLACHALKRILHSLHRAAGQDQGVGPGMSRATEMG